MNFRLRPIWLSLIVFLPGVAHAQTFNGCGLTCGLNAIRGKFGQLFQGDLRAVISRILSTVLDLMGFIAVIMIIIAGIYLIVGQGSDDSQTKAKNIVIYTIVGLILILLSRVIVGFAVNILN
ncbi:MAG: hypothetical protein JWM56_1386 [Candidatus Peribacteria bacterium]|nr:hypothetical protein [Candidatus Peribacteria bacterium]